MNLHLELKDKIEAHYAGQLSGDAVLKQDALLVTFDDGVQLELRYPNPDEYSIAWLWGSALMRVDTAPMHEGLASFPNHFHDLDGKVREDRITKPGRDPWDNVRSLVDAIRKDPCLTA
ncbi:MAG: DUF6516 family protein [Pseudomonadota bacterium]|jgi:hypothetical protein